MKGLIYILNIFKNCSKLSQIKLGNDPPLLFNENVFVNAGIVPNVSIPNNENWVNYISQSTIDPSSNHYIWFGYDTGLEKNKNKCPKNLKTTVIVLAVFTALFGAGLIGFLVILELNVRNHKIFFKNINDIIY